MVYCWLECLASKSYIHIAFFLNDPRWTTNWIDQLYGYQTFRFFSGKSRIFILCPVSGGFLWHFVTPFCPGFGQTINCLPRCILFITRKFSKCCVFSDVSDIESPYKSQLRKFTSLKNSEASLLNFKVTMIVYNRSSLYLNFFYYSYVDINWTFSVMFPYPY